MNGRGMLQHTDDLNNLLAESHRREELTPDCTFEWVAEGRIRLTTLRSTDRVTIDAWYDYCVQFREQWKPTEPPLFLLVNITTAIEELTPYARQRSVDIARFRPEIPTYCAVLLPESLIGQIIKLYIWSITTFSPNLKVQVFFDFEASLQWLMSHVEKHSQAHGGEVGVI
ncbi:MAG: hypothetical protein KF716_05430 [Anaerolineae bacterium]|nr:hypothetical protein [Anaerolineae bacterium]